ncbi:hypothetical protein Nepgr_022967 [Nepenthes gracilis]|uniref:Uncharacterized protein n=1 Tax=Nepenthes gracilis TaxID=150966 RepID=A0AAD3T0F1_NEPGR|nr:hypothetical protein Nepgr_022967 [Nepenthes gracilis]
MGLVALCLCCSEVYSLEVREFQILNALDAVLVPAVARMMQFSVLLVPMDDIAQGEFCCRAACDDNC